MTKTRVWLQMMAMVLLASAVLFYVAAIRFPMHPVDPMPPQPDYRLQELIAYVGVAVVWVSGIVVAAMAGRRSMGQRRLVTRGCLTITLIAIAAVIAAMTIPAP